MHLLMTWHVDNTDEPRMEPAGSICKCDLNFDHDVDSNPVAVMTTGTDQARPVTTGGDSVDGG